MQALITTIDQTIEHIRGTKKMSSEEMFAAFKVPSGKARFDEEVKLADEPIDCKVSGQDTGGAMCVFGFSGSSSGLDGTNRLLGQQDIARIVLDQESVKHSFQRWQHDVPGKKRRT